MLTFLHEEKRLKSRAKSMGPLCCLLLENHWMESLDYRYFRIHINSHTCKYDENSKNKKICIVVCSKNPGSKYPNWLNTCGHENGTMCFRWVKPENRPCPQPSTQVVKFDKLFQNVK